MTGILKNKIIFGLIPPPLSLNFRLKKMLYRTLAFMQKSFSVSQHDYSHYL